MSIENPTPKEEKRARWASHIEQWNASGQSQSDYCRQHQLKLHQLVYWKQVFNTQHKVKPPAENKFIAVQLTRSPIPPTQEMIIQLPNGIRIESAQSNNLELIREMVRW